MNLRNATALVTGGSSGIGLAIAKALVDAGSRVAITGRNQHRLAEPETAIGAHPIKADRAKFDAILQTNVIGMMLMSREAAKHFVERKAGNLINFAATAGFSQDDKNPTKLQTEDIAHVVKAVLEMNDRGFTTELTVFATNPKD